MAGIVHPSVWRVVNSHARLAVFRFVVELATAGIDRVDIVIRHTFAARIEEGCLHAAGNRLNVWVRYVSVRLAFVTGWHIDAMREGTGASGDEEQASDTEFSCDSEH